MRSQPQKGSCFSFNIELDLDTEPTAELLAKIPTTPVISSTMKILVVDDSHINRRVALRLLEKLNIHADAANSGFEALDRLQTETYDVILMDMQMPEMDGLETTQKIRQLHLTKRPFIIALTANAFDSDRERCLQAGMDEFLTKPFVFEDLQEKIALSTASR